MMCSNMLPACADVLKTKVLKLRTHSTLEYQHGFAQNKSHDITLVSRWAGIFQSPSQR
jgi:hypothetical protein